MFEPFPKEAIVELAEQSRAMKSLNVKHFSKRVQSNKGNVFVKTCSHFKYVITLHVVAWLELRTQPEVTPLC